MADLGDPVQIQTLEKPTLYSEQQIGLAYAIARALNAGTFVLVEPPRR